MRALLALICLLGTANAKVMKAITPAERVLAHVNVYRAAAGLTPVRLDPKLSAGCMEHANYMKLNRGTDAMIGLNAHKQRPELPGASPAGAACGKAADLFPEVSDLDAAVDGWMASLYHRRPMLNPALQTIGVGYAELPEGTLMAALMFADADESKGTWPVHYPATGQTDVPLEFGNEVPNPIPANGKGGYPLTLQFPSFDKVTGASATLEAGGKAVPFYLSDPEHPATSFGQYGVICVIPKQRLAPHTRYDASITATWHDKTTTLSWSFTTLDLRALDANDETAMLAAVGIASRVHGVVAYGGMMDTETAFLMIGPREPTKYKMLSVLIPIAVWRQLAGRAKPESYAGKTLDVEATPVFVQNKFLNLPVTLATQVMIH